MVQIRREDAEKSNASGVVGEHITGWLYGPILQAPMFLLCCH